MQNKKMKWKGLNMKWEGVNTLRLGNIAPLSNEDISFRLKVGKIQQAAWFGLLALIVLALMGFFGNDYTFQNQSLQNESGLEVPYLSTSAKPTTWTLRVQPSNEIWLSSKLSTFVRFEKISPVPDQTRFSEQRIHLHYNQAPAKIEFTVRAKRNGFVEGKIGTANEVFDLGYLSIP